MRGRSNGKITILLEDKPYMDRILNTPVNRLTTEELFLAELHFMLEDAKKGDKELLTFRDSINFCWNWRWSELQTILKKHREELDKLFRRYGYIRVSKTGWRKFSYETRPERCNHKENGCVFWSLTVYNILRKMEEKGLIKSEKTIHYDHRKGKGLRLDTFRFWFINREAYHNRVEKQKLTAYLLRDKL